MKTANLHLTFSSLSISWKLQNIIKIKHKYLIEIFEFAMSHDEAGEFEIVIIISFL
jgi:hypothetical protein